MDRPSLRSVHTALTASVLLAALPTAGLIVGAAYAAYAADAAVSEDSAETVVIVAILVLLYVGLVGFRLARTVLLRRLVASPAAWSWSAWWSVNRAALPRPLFLPLLLRQLLGRGTRQKRMWQDWVRCALRMRDPLLLPADPEPPAPVAASVLAGVVAALVTVQLPGPLGLLGAVAVSAAVSRPMAVRTVRALELEPEARARS